MAVGFFSMSLAKADFVPAGVPLDQQHALFNISSVRPMDISKSVYIAKNKASALGSAVYSCQNPLNSFSGHGTS